MPGRRPFRPSCDAVEPRILLSVAHPPMVHIARAGIAGGMAVGFARGKATLIPHDPRIEDIPDAYQLTGLGRFTLLGQARLTGQFDIGGFKAPGSPDSGLIRLGNPAGGLTIQLSGPLQRDTSGMISGTMTATVLGGTGRFAKLTGTGQATLEVRPAAGKFLVSLGMKLKAH